MSTTSRAIRGPIAFWALAGLALLASHDAVFFAQLGPGEELVRTLRSAGHEYWTLASLALAGTALAVSLAAAIRILRLRGEARRLGASPARGTTPLGGRVLATWSRLFALVLIGFVVQESLEHLGMHGHVIGLGAVMGPEYPLAMPVIGLITLAAAVVSVLIAGAEEVLLRTIAAALRSTVGRAPRLLARPPERLDGPRIPILARLAAGRAPPRMLAIGTT